MPLPVLPSNNTARCWIDYTSFGRTHHMMFRLGFGATPANASTKATALANILKNRMRIGDAFTSARFSAEGSDFSLPVTFAAVAGTVDESGGAAIWQEDADSAFITFVGRGSSSARRVDWFFYTGIKTPTWPYTNRYNPGEAAVIDTLRTNFATWVNTSASPGEQVVTVGQDIPSVYGYVNIAKNAYWQRKQR